MNYSKRILIIGFGSIARKHIRILNKYWPDFEIAIYKEGKLLECDELHLYSNKFSTYQECIDWEPNFAIIASPCSFHLDQALFFSSKGIPTLREKPIGEGSENKVLGKNFSNIKRVPIMVGYVFRHDECLKRLDNILHSHNLEK